LASIRALIAWPGSRSSARIEVRAAGGSWRTKARLAPLASIRVRVAVAGSGLNSG
jgi:hypothetical protein